MSTGGPYIDRWQPGIPPQDPSGLWAWLVDRAGNLSRILGAIQHRTEIAVASLEPAVKLAADVSLTATSFTTLMSIVATPLVTGVARVLAPLGIYNAGTGGIQINFDFFVNGVDQGTSAAALWPTNMIGSIQCHGEFPVTGGKKYAIDLRYMASNASSAYKALGSGNPWSAMYLYLGVPSSSLALP